MESQQADALVHRWTSYSGTGKNVFGRAVLHGHGYPEGVFRLEPDVLRWWIERNDPVTVWGFYDVLVSEDEAEIEKRVATIWEEILSDRE